MKIAVMTFRLHTPWVHSLKEKRMIVKSLIAKLQNKFHVSVAEVDEQYAMLATDGMLVKRPLLVGDGFVLTGFKEDDKGYFNTMQPGVFCIIDKVHILG